MQLKILTHLRERERKRKEIKTKMTLMIKYYEIAKIVFLTMDYFYSDEK